MDYNIKNILQYMPSGCAIIRSSGIFEVISGNDEFFAPSGYTESEIRDLPNDIYDIIYKADVAKLRRTAEAAMYSGEMHECEIRIYNKQGELHWLAMRLKFYCYKDSTPCFIASTWDIHERKRMEEELCLQSERYKLLEEVNNEVPFEYDVKEHVFLLPKNNSAFSRTGRTMLHQNEIKKLIHPEDMERVWKIIEEVSQQPREGTVEYRMRLGEEEKKYIWYRAIYKSIRGMDGKVVRVLGRAEDISVQKSRQDEIARQLRKDSLTGVLNKEASKAAIEEFLRTEPEGEHAFFLIDVDNFKNVNDTFGHLFGDSVLVTVAEKIQALFRGNDIVGRVGGDEFIAFMKHASPAQAKIKAQSICDAVNQEYNGMEEQIEISCSVGVSLYQKGRGNYTTLFSQADRAMYRAKKAGKNQYSVVEAMNPKWRLHRRKEIENRDSQYKAGKEQGDDFLIKAFLLLSHAKDVNNSLNMLVERIGRQYDLGAVAVLECDFQKREVCRTNAWNRQDGLLPKMRFSEESSRWKCMLERMDRQEMVCINDCRDGMEIGETELEIFRENGIRAMMSGSFSYFERGKGYVMFCDTEKARTWEKYEQEIFQELVRLLSVFAAVRRQQEEEQQTIRKLKRRDALTGLYNEEVFKEKVHEILGNWDETMQYAIVYADINDFSYINDNYGQEVGNDILRKLADHIRNAPQSVSCRLYSDLFISFLWEKSREDIMQNVLRTNMSFNSQQKKRYAGENIRLSTGIYFMESPREKLEIAIENANLARKSIKGNDSIFCRVYEKKLRQQREKEKKIIEEFTQNLEEERFKVFIQPQFRLDKRKFVGGEALVRRQTQKGKIESPDNFIPALEKSGDIVKLDFYVYEQVLRTMKKWQEEGIELPVISVNFSRRHFEEGGIYYKVMEGAENYGIPPSSIEIEITESLFTSAYDLVKMEMKKLRSAGFSVAIDDFGTGYSSLSMLMDIPSDVVKIDKSFLSRENSKKGWQFIENMGRLIHSVQEQVIVEGIETEEQYEFLKKCGFEYGQGYLFERPIPLPVFEEKYIK